MNGGSCPRARSTRAMNLSSEAPGFSASCSRKLKAPANNRVKVLTTSVPSSATASQRARCPASSGCSRGVSMLTSSNTSRPASRLGSNFRGNASNRPANTMIQLARVTWRGVKVIQPQRQTTGKTRSLPALRLQA
ncbi:hypothetical protein D3C81_1323380 [compost metagenome]